MKFMSAAKEKRNRVTKELALAITPLAAAYLFISFYEAGFCSHFGIPIELIKISFNDVLLTNRLTLMVAVLAFLWIGLYYNVLPSANSPVFKGMITMILILCFWLGFTFGEYDANNKKDYLVLQGPQEQVVIKIYGDKIITAHFDRQSKTIEKNFQVHLAGENPNLIYRLQAVGPLKLK